jgi:hypothetical protein
MMRSLLFWISLLIVSLAVVAGALVFLHSEPSTATLDADLATMRSEIVATERERSQGSRGAIGALTSLRLAIFKTTEAMLSQKRESLLRGINLTYTVKGHPLTPVTDEALSKIAKDLAGAQQKLAKDEVEVQRYSGGLIQALSLMTVAADRLSVAEIELAYYGSKYGIALPVQFHPPADIKPGQSAPGAIVKDKDAL